MTKTEEIAMIDKLIADHAHDTYLGNYLKMFRSQIVRLISLDLPLELVDRAYPDDEVTHGKRLSSHSAGSLSQP